MLIENGVWKGYDHEDLQNGILRIPEQVQKLDLQSIHKCMFEHFGGGKRYGLQIDSRNPIYYSEGNCMIERKTGTIVFGTAESKLPQSGKVYSIGTGAFAWCDFGDKKIDIPGSIENVEKCAFYGAWGIRELRFLSGVRRIGDFALSATVVKNIYFSETVEQIGFCDLPDTVVALKVDERNPVFSSKNNCLIREQDKTALAIVGTSAKIPEGIRAIASFACMKGTSPTRLIIIPDTVMKIENDAMPNSLLRLMYGRNFQKSKTQRLRERGNFYSDGEAMLPVAIIKAHRNSYAITYAQQHRVAHLYLEENE